MVKNVLKKVLCFNLVTVLFLLLFTSMENRIVNAAAIPMVVTGAHHTAFLRSDGSLWTWGDNTNGQLGDGTYESSYIPKKIMDDIIFVSARGNSTMAVKSNGSLWAWGMASDNSSTPTIVMEGVASVSAYTEHYAAIKQDGTLWTWGRNAYGQLGNGTNSDNNKPEKVMSDVSSVSLDVGYTMAIKNDGSLWAWGLNDGGKLGNGTTDNTNLPTEIMQDVSSVSASSSHGNAIKTNGTLWAWGYSRYGFGDVNSTQNSTSPIHIMDGVGKVSTGSTSTAIIKQDGSLWVWGGNSYGEVGNGTTDTISSPQRIMDGVDSVSTSFHTAAIKQDGSLWTWGLNDYGQLGIGTTTNSHVPVEVRFDETTELGEPTPNGPSDPYPTPEPTQQEPIINMVVNPYYVEDWTNEDISITLTPHDYPENIITDFYYNISDSLNLPESHKGWPSFIADGEVPVGAATNSIRLSEEGEHYLNWYVRNNRGASKYGTAGSYKIDKTAPVVSSQALMVTSNSAEIRIFAQDNLSGIKQVTAYGNNASEDGNGGYDGSYIVTLRQLNSDTSYNIPIRVTDNAGNLSESHIDIRTGTGSTGGGSSGGGSVPVLPINPPPSRDTTTQPDTPKTDATNGTLLGTDTTSGTEQLIGRVQYSALRSVTNESSAIKTVTAEIAKFSQSELNNPDLIDALTLFTESAISRSAIHKTTSNTIDVADESLRDVGTKAGKVRDNILQLFKRNNFTLNRTLKLNLIIETTAKQPLDLTFSKLSSTSADGVTIKSPYFSLTVNKEFIEANTKNGLQFDNLDFSSTMQHNNYNALTAGRLIASSPDNNNKYLNPSKILLAKNTPSYKVNVELTPPSTSNSNTYSVNFSKPVEQNVTVSLPKQNGDTTYQAVVNSDDAVVGGKYNPATEMIDFKTNVNGNFKVKENKKDFSDIQNKSREMQEAIRYLASKGVIEGTSSSQFSPDTSISRAQIASLVLKALAKLDPKATANYKDVKRSDWYYAVAASAKKYNVMSGFPDNTFQGSKAISKEQIVVIAARVLTTEMGYKTANSEQYLSVYKDRNSIGSWAKPFVSVATRENLVIKRSDGMFRPDSNMTRGDAAIIIKKLFDKIW